MRRIKLSRKAFICILLCLIVVVTSGVVFASAGADKQSNVNKKTDNVNSMSTNEPSNVNKTDDSVDVPQVDVNKTATVESAPAVTQTPQATAPAKTEPLDGGHIPFTNKDVTPGDPQSYVGTVGQCPFYEMAGDKGCYPPADIKCNADWSMCDPVVDQKGEVK